MWFSSIARPNERTQCQIVHINAKIISWSDKKWLFTSNIYRFDIRSVWVIRNVGWCSERAWFCVNCDGCMNVIIFVWYICECGAMFCSNIKMFWQILWSVNGNNRHWHLCIKVLDCCATYVLSHVRWLHVSVSKRLKAFHMVIFIGLLLTLYSPWMIHTNSTTQ